MKCKKGYKKSGGKCVKKNSRRNNPNDRFEPFWMIITIVGILAVVGIFFYGGKAGWFLSISPVDSGLASFLNSPETSSPTCSLSIVPNSIWVGDRITGTIVDGKNKLCSVYILQGGDWLSIYEGYTDSNGILTDIRTMNTPGNFTFRAICDLNENDKVDTNDCLTNQADLTVIPRPGDSDGDGFTDQEEADAGTDPNDPNNYPGSDDSNGDLVYTCGQGSDVDSCYGTCPSGYWCEAVYFGDYDACACVDGLAVHPYWKPDGSYHNPMDTWDEEDDIPDEQTIGQYCVDLGYDKHWDTYSEGNCIQGAINECGDGFFDYLWDAEKEWCCYRCTSPPEPDCDTECLVAGYPYGGWYSGGISCGDFVHYLPGPMCCCDTLFTYCQDSCYADGFLNSIPFVDTGWDCPAWAGSYCSGGFNSRDDGTCCCWNCN